jgi:UDP:flavonoid glycosyltransferase YjiC (YdhE family)
VAACGAGLVLTPDADVGEISHAIRAMLVAPEYRTAARHMAATIALRDGREVAVDALERLLHTISS